MQIAPSGWPCVSSVIRVSGAKYGRVFFFPGIRKYIHSYMYTSYEKSKAGRRRRRRRTYGLIPGEEGKKKKLVSNKMTLIT